MTAEAPVKSRPRRKRAGDFHHGDLREQLVVAATAMVQARGHEQVTLRALAERVGVTEPAVYRHFAGKDALLAEVGARGLRQMQTALVAPLATHDDPFAAAAAVGRAYVRFAHAHAGWFRLWFSRSRTEGIGHLAPADDDEAARALLALMGRLVEGRALAPMDLFRALWAQWHGLAVLVVERVFQLVQSDDERLAVADVAIDVFIGALRDQAQQGG
jgi:AcrR family transcriptional regulator